MSNFCDRRSVYPGYTKRLKGVVFEKSAPDPAATTTDQPVNVLGWPTRGQIPDGLVSQMSVAGDDSAECAGAVVNP